MNVKQTFWSVSGLLEGRAARETASRLSTTARPLQAVLLLKGIKVYCKFKASVLQRKASYEDWIFAIHLHCNKNMKNILDDYEPIRKLDQYLQTCGSSKYQGYFGSSQITLNTTTSSNRGNIKPLPADRCSDRECWGLCKKQHVTSLSSHMNLTLWEGTSITDLDTVAQTNIEQWKSRHSIILSFDPYKSRNGMKCWYRREEVNSDNAATLG